MIYFLTRCGQPIGRRAQAGRERRGDSDPSSLPRPHHASKRRQMDQKPTGRFYKGGVLNFFEEKGPFVFGTKSLCFEPVYLRDHILLRKCFVDEVRYSWGHIPKIEV